MCSVAAISICVYCWKVCDPGSTSQSFKLAVCVHMLCDFAVAQAIVALTVHSGVRVFIVVTFTDVSHTACLEFCQVAL